MMVRADNSMHFLPLLAGWLVNGIVGHDLSRAMDYRGIMIDATVSEIVQGC